MLLQQIMPNLIYQFKSETELINSIQKLSDNFTKDRSKLDEYLTSEKLVSAYTAFYLTTNIPKWDHVIQKLQIAEDDLSELEIVDIGSGPGTYALAQLANNKNQIIYGVESSELMRLQATKLLSNFYPESSVKFFKTVREVPEKKRKRLGVFGHSANEMEVSQVNEIIEKLDLDQVLFIEPGTKSYFEKALEIRKNLINKNFSILYPCPSQASCPMEETQDWCHQFLYIKQNPEIERICQIVKKDRKLLPQIIHYFKKGEDTPRADLKRVIRVYKPTKFGLEMQICHQQDSENKLFDLQQLFRKKSKVQMKKLQNILAGDEIRFEPVKSLEKNMIRGDIKLED